jgi:hypothetical protein
MRILAVTGGCHRRKTAADAPNLVSGAGAPASQSASDGTPDTNTGSTTPSIDCSVTAEVPGALPRPPYALPAGDSGNSATYGLLYCQ